MIDYAVTLLRNPAHDDEPKRAYAFLQSRGTLNINELADHMVAHGCQYDRGDIAAIITKVVTCVKELLLDGYRISLGDLGRLFLTCSSLGAATLSEFTRANIQSMRVNFVASKQFADLVQRASLHRVPTRRAAAATLEAQTDGKTQADWTPEPDDIVVVPA